MNTYIIEDIRFGAIKRHVKKEYGNSYAMTLLGIMILLTVVAGSS